MEWKGKELRTIGDLMNAVTRCKSPTEAQEFMAEYRKQEPTAAHESNIGYLSGYLSPERMRQVQEWFNVAHPIFGNATPTPEEAFEAGAKAMMKEAENE